MKQEVFACDWPGCEKTSLSNHGARTCRFWMSDQVSAVSGDFCIEHGEIARQLIRKLSLEVTA